MMNTSFQLIATNKFSDNFRRSDCSGKGNALKFTRQMYQSINCCDKVDTSFGADHIVDFIQNHTGKTIEYLSSTNRTEEDIEALWSCDQNFGWVVEHPASLGLGCITTSSQYMQFWKKFSGFLEYFLKFI